MMKAGGGWRRAPLGKIGIFKTLEMLFFGILALMFALLQMLSLPTLKGTVW